MTFYWDDMISNIGSFYRVKPSQLFLVVKLLNSDIAFKCGQTYHLHFLLVNIYSLAV